MPSSCPTPTRAEASQDPPNPAHPDRAPIPHTYHQKHERHTHTPLNHPQLRAPTPAQSTNFATTSFLHRLA
eukprot:5040360-Prorocentrum_lima.AAC.1